MRPIEFATGEILTRTFDAERVNAVINDPSVRPFVGDPDLGDLDVSDAVENEMNLALMGEHGGFLLTWSCPRVYEVHTFITKGGRGAWARQAAAETIAYAKRCGANRLWTKISPDQPNVEAFATEMGMRDTLQSVLTLGKPYSIFEMSV